MGTYMIFVFDAALPIFFLISYIAGTRHIRRYSLVNIKYKHILSAYSHRVYLGEVYHRLRRVIGIICHAYCAVIVLLRCKSLYFSPFGIIYPRSRS